MSAASPSAASPSAASASASPSAASSPTEASKPSSGNKIKRRARSRSKAQAPDSAPVLSDAEREALLNELFLSFADFSEKASQIFRSLSSGGRKSTAATKKGGKGAGVKQKKLSGYQIFANGKRTELKAGAPNASFGAVSQKIGALWKEMSAADKNFYTDRAATMNDVIVRNEDGGINVAATIQAHEQACGSRGAKHHLVLVYHIVMPLDARGMDRMRIQCHPLVLQQVPREKVTLTRIALRE
eukprot:SAG31_NODE_8109_length_1521_cov_4.158228_2_plen_243_part_00